MSVPSQTVLRASLETVLSGRLTRDSISSLLDAFDAAAAGDLPRASAQLAKARTLAVAVGVRDREIR